MAVSKNGRRIQSLVWQQTRTLLNLRHPRLCVVSSFRGLEPGQIVKQEFLDNFRVARNLFVHRHVPVDSPQGDPRAIARASIWLTPKSVRGFDPNDFRDLDDDRRKELERALTEFLAVAGEVPASQAATPEQLARAQLVFATLLQILEPYLPTPVEGEEVERALENVELPPWVVNWDYELGTDEDGEPVVWINLFVDENSAPRSEFGRLASRVNVQAREALAATGSQRSPYVRLRTAIEHKTA